MPRMACGVLAIGGGGLGAGAAAFGQWWWPAPLLLGLVGAWIAVRGCRHPHPGLLPPLRGEGPERDHARWYCDQCGHTWSASIAPSQPPIPRFGGFDQSKAVVAAGRARALDRQRRRLAIERAGLPLDPPRPASAPQVLRMVAQGGRGEARAVRSRPATAAEPAVPAADDLPNPS
ncbi:MAG: hypothetical protein R2752_10620 [Vicinamibacterales bacterium]